jgi:site-specific DNA-cytosine methylase
MPLRVGTDCSGIDVAVWVLRDMGVDVQHVFSSEVDATCVRTIRANHQPEVLYGDPASATPDGDITRRDHARAAV